MHGSRGVNTGVGTLLLASLARYYSDVRNMEAVLPYINGSSHISLRMIEWFITSYCKRYNVTIIDETGKSTTNVYMSYRAQLKAYSKQQFDPFRRHDRISFTYAESQTIETTIGQLNFFRWMLMYGVLSYMEHNIHAIEQDLVHQEKESKRGKEGEAEEKKKDKEKDKEKEKEAKVKVGWKADSGFTLSSGRHTIDFT